MPLIGATTNSTAAAGASAAGSATGATGALGDLGSEAFMQLLVAQMKYQNPMAPSDGTEYLSQISQYAMVEQLQKVTQSQQEVSTYQRALIANSMIGKLVAGTGETGVIVSGQVLGVDFQAGKPVLVTTGGDLAVDKVDEARLPSGSTATASTLGAGPSVATPSPKPSSDGDTSTPTATPTATNEGETAQ